MDQAFPPAGATEPLGERRTKNTVSPMIKMRPTPPPTAMPMIAPVDQAGEDEDDEEDGTAAVIPL